MNQMQTPDSKEETKEETALEGDSSAGQPTTERPAVPSSKSSSLAGGPSKVGDPSAGNPSEADPSTADPSKDSGQEKRGAWIENEGFLRDEGTVLGLAGAEDSLEHRTEAIRGYFEEKKEEAARRRRRAKKEVERARECRSAAEDKIRRLEKKTGAPWRPEPNQEPQTHGRREWRGGRPGLFRYGLGALFATGICGFNGVLLLELLRSHFERPSLVAVGICLTGFFSLFQPTSIFVGEPSDNKGSSREGDRAPSPWKRWLVEAGMPVAAALFVTSWVYAELGPLRAGSLFLYLVMTFLLGGKLLLHAASRLARAASNLRRDLGAWLLRRKARKNLSRLREEVLPEQKDREMEAARRLEELRSQEEIESRRQAATQLFRSEYALARQAAEDGAFSSEDAPLITNSANR